MKVPDYIGRGLLWLMVLLLVPFAVMIFLATLAQAVVVAGITAAFCAMIFLISFLTRNTPTGKRLRAMEQARKAARSAETKKRSNIGRQDG